MPTENTTPGAGKPTPRNIGIDSLSVVPLFVELVCNGGVLGSGTGFVVQKANRSYLTTNWHVVTNRDPATGQPMNPSGTVPNEIRIWHHKKGHLGAWVRRTVALFSDRGEPNWIEHRRGREVDVIAVPLSIDSEIQVYPMELSLADADLKLVPSEPVSIIGFPFGVTSSGLFPIWKTGHIASDLDIDYDGKPMFIIDATTKAGMSGSPVVARRIGSYTRKGGGMTVGRDITRFLGIYSGRTIFDDQVEIGMVWRPEVLDEILP